MESMILSTDKEPKILRQVLKIKTIKLLTNLNENKLRMSSDDKLIRVTYNLVFGKKNELLSYEALFCLQTYYSVKKRVYRIVLWNNKRHNSRLYVKVYSFKYKKYLYMPIQSMAQKGIYANEL